MEIKISLPILPLSHAASLEKLQFWRSQVNTALQNVRGSNTEENSTCLNIFQLAIGAEIDFLQSINSDLIQSPVMWNEVTDFLSIPSFLADISKQADRTNNFALSVVLKSLTHWTLVARDTVQPRTALGLRLERFRNKFLKARQNSRKAEISLWSRFIVESKEKNIKLKQVLAVSSDDSSNDRLRDYFNLKAYFLTEEGRIIIFSHELVLNKKEEINLTVPRTYRVPLFNLNGLTSLIAASSD